MSFKKSLFAVSAVAMMAGGAYAADSLTIAIVNNGHMINMQKVAEGGRRSARASDIRYRNWWRSIRHH